MKTEPVKERLCCYRFFEEQGKTETKKWGRGRDDNLRGGLGGQSQGLERSLSDCLENWIGLLENRDFSGKWVGSFHYLFKLPLV